MDTVAATNFENGLPTWDLDAINVAERGYGRVVPQDGTGVYVAVLDTGLMDTWRQYFPEQRIASEYGIASAKGLRVDPSAVRMLPRAVCERRRAAGRQAIR